MIKKLFFLGFLCAQLQLLCAQVGLNTATPQAFLDVESSNAGILVPRVSLSGLDDTTSIENPHTGTLAASTLVYNTVVSGVGSNEVRPGFYFWNGAQWESPYDSQWLKSNSTFKSTSIDDHVYTYGKVGINIDEPSYDLEILGDVRLTRDNSLFVANGNLDTNNGIRVRFTNRAHWYNKGDKSIWRTSGLDVGSGMDNTVLTTINQNGYTSLGEGDPNERLHVIQDDAMLDTDQKFLFGHPGENTDVMQFQRVNTATEISDLQLWIGDNDGGPDADSFVLGFFDLNATPRVFKASISFKANGVASKLSAGPWSTLSDERVKEDIKPFKDGLSQVIAIDPVTFQYNGKAQTQDDGNTYVGVIAQQVAPIIPYLISQEKDSEIDGLLSYDATALDYMLVNAINTLSEHRELLQSRLKEIHLRLDSLQKRVHALTQQNKPNTTTQNAE